ncbi:IS1634 family transposase [Actinomyces respiraculi]|uniref:IS1634 family transposase n=1 Tax=Actinomyces respiraculi TaxID=2744574 RepID=A0A7T0LMT6_9ACTO|nr:IS1634 family transposase [Actinomyces respiraculi]QPL06628.1 IS1634 family transposase [Actinomyces respiraculi]QPL06638.1 IS1634 family transposase [Actinomyces respiraculi]QPL06639.1 IS1634 family transposase [Actinomyces respiraculi]QPL06674.1 IS1634 family transposase [Actinomyces respiraculi]
MSPFIRQVRTASGATAVQIAVKEGRRNKVVEHIGSAHTPGELAALVQVAQEKLHPGQLQLDLDLPSGSAGSRPGVHGDYQQTAIGAAHLVSHRSGLLWQVLCDAWQDLGFDQAVDDEAFKQIVLARLIEPTSKSAIAAMLTSLGLESFDSRTHFRALTRCVERDYRSALARAALEHCLACGDVSLVLYDVTTLYFEAEKEDALRKVGYSKERRVDPQILVGLLADRNGFPLEVSCWEGNKAETHTLIPTIEAFKQRAGAEHLVVVADAGMLSSANLQALDQAGYGFIVGARQTKAPLDLQAHFFWHGDCFTDGQTIDTITPRHGGKQERNQHLKDEPVWHPQTHPGSWRAIWVYSRKRAARDSKTLTLQENRARAIVAGEKAMRSARFVTTSSSGRGLDEKALARARRLEGLKGYVTNIPARTMSASEIVADYHNLWKVEQSFRMSKHDLRARPVFHHTRQAIEAHLTVVTAALAVARHLQAATGVSIKKIVQALRPVIDVTININGHELTATSQPQGQAANILASLTNKTGH